MQIAMPNPRLKEMPESEMPRERLASRGVTALSDVELLALLLNQGFKGMNVLDLAGSLLRKHGSLGALARLSFKELQQHPGIKEGKASHLAAAFAIGSRIARERILRQKLDTPDAVFDLLSPEMSHLVAESLRVILLDTRYHLLRIEEISKGSVNESIAHPREIFRPAIHHAAFGMILAHNHPSGDPSPSEADLRLTRRLREAAQLLSINLLDHVIIGTAATGRAGYYSFKEAGLL